MEQSCKNCHYHFTGNFCNQCGQTADTQDINFKSFVHEIQHGLLNWDKGIWFTTRELLTRPGHSIREYMEGKRVMHFKPLAYLLLLASLYLLFNKWSKNKTILEEFLLGVSSAWKDQPDAANYLLPLQVTNWMINNYAYTTLLLLPVFSFASFLVFKSQQRNYFQHLLLNTFIAGQRTAVFLLLVPVTYYLVPAAYKDVTDILRIFLGVFLTFWTYYQFFDRMAPWKRLVWTGAYYILGLLLLFLLLVAFMAVTVWGNS